MSNVQLMLLLDNPTFKKEEENTFTSPLRIGKSNLTTNYDRRPCLPLLRFLMIEKEVSTKGGSLKLTFAGWSSSFLGGCRKS